MKVKRRSQRRVRSRHGWITRRRFTPAVLETIADRVDADADRHNVSRSFVIAVILADHYRIRSQERY